MGNLKLSKVLESFLKLHPTPKSGGKNTGNTSHGIKWEQQLENWFNKHNIQYSYQPNGSQMPPEFRVRMPNGKTIEIEQKTSKTGKPMWNSTLPQAGTLYIVGCTESGKNGMWFGEDLIENTDRDRLEEFHKTLMSLVNSYNQAAGSDSKYYYGQRGRFDTRFNPFKDKSDAHLNKEKLNTIRRLNAELN